jgi:hypothetical protein
MPDRRIAVGVGDYLPCATWLFRCHDEGVAPLLGKVFQDDAGGQHRRHEARLAQQRGKKALLNAAQLHSVYEREESAIGFVVKTGICSGHAMNSEFRIS